MHHDDREMSALGPVTDRPVSIPIPLRQRRSVGCFTYPLHTDEGLTGLGELSSVFARRGPLLCRDVDERLGPVLVGRDPLAITSALRAMETALPDGQLAIAGVEMALWDIAGKALGMPVHTLLGGKVRDRIPLSYSIPHGEPEQMAEYALHPRPLRSHDRSAAPVRSRW